MANIKLVAQQIASEHELQGMEDRKEGRENAEDENARPSAQSSALTKLPTEIMLQIVVFLDSAAFAASLAFTCKDIRSSIGTCYPALKEDKADLLMLLQREMPDHIACRSCTRFHSMDCHQYPNGVFIPSLSCYVDKKGENKLPACQYNDIVFQYRTHTLPEDLHSSVLQMTMKCQRLGLPSNEYSPIIRGPSDNREIRREPHTHG